MITPEDLLQHAEFLHQQSSEVSWRDGIKHSYYYLYHLAKQFVEAHQIGSEMSRDQMGEHQYLIARIRSIDGKLAKSVSRDLQMLKDKRTLCCYHLKEDVTKIMLLQQLYEAKQAAGRLNKLVEFVENQADESHNKIEK